MTPYILIRAEPGGGLTLVCTRCGQTYAPTLPIPVSLLGALTDEWEKMHAECLERTGPPKPTP